MKIELYEQPALDVGQEDARIVNVLRRLTALGIDSQRYDPFAHPDAFRCNAALNDLMDNHGMEALPAVFVDGELMAWGTYPANSQFWKWVGTACGDGCKGCAGTCGGCGGCHEKNRTV